MSKEPSDSSRYCMEFILGQLQLHSDRCERGASHPPFFLGLSGIQGSGKTTVTSVLSQKLSQRPHGLKVVVLSLDDFYLTHEAQCRLAKSHPDNPLIQHRGQPSTHDLKLAVAIVSDLQNGRSTCIPRYDKSAFDGQGDRAPQTQWLAVDQENESDLDLVILEGWCVGFRTLPKEQLISKWQDAVDKREKTAYRGRLGWTNLESVSFINEALRDYDVLTSKLHALIHMDAEDTNFVYSWRLEAEARLHESEGAGMTNEEVKKFVNGYYPAYELFTEGLRAGIFHGKKANQLRLILDKDRRIKSAIKI